MRQRVIKEAVGTPEEKKTAQPLPSPASSVVALDSKGVRLNIGDLIPDLVALAASFLCLRELALFANVCKHFSAATRKPSAWGGVSLTSLKHIKKAMHKKVLRGVGCMDLSSGFTTDARKFVQSLLSRTDQGQLAVRSLSLYGCPSTDLLPVCCVVVLLFLLLLTVSHICGFLWCLIVIV